MSDLYFFQWKKKSFSEVDWHQFLCVPICVYITIAVVIKKVVDYVKNWKTLKCYRIDFTVRVSKVCNAVNCFVFCFSFEALMWESDNNE